MTSALANLRQVLADPETKRAIASARADPTAPGAADLLRTLRLAELVLEVKEAPVE